MGAMCGTAIKLPRPISAQAQSQRMSSLAIAEGVTTVAAQLLDVVCKNFVSSGQVTLTRCSLNINNQLWRL